VALAAQSILLGEAECVVAGGMENMTLSPYLLAKARFGYRMGPEQIIDSMIADGLSCPLTFTHMGITAENIAAKYGITREAQDAFSASSQQKAGAAQASGALDEEIFTIEIAQKKGDPLKVSKDEYPRPSTTAEALSKLRPLSRRTAPLPPATLRGSTTAPRRWW